MSLKSEITLTWGDGEFLFALKGAQIEELERVCGKVGFAEIHQRLILGIFSYAEVYHTVRLALIGGGMGAVEAKIKTDLYILPIKAGPNSALSVAKAALGGVFDGFEDLSSPGEAVAGN